MKIPRIDASIVCFALVVVAAVPVATLRSRTYSLGYDLGKLKQQEKAYRQRNTELKLAIAKTQRSIREQYFGAHAADTKNTSPLALPNQEHVFGKTQKEQK